MTTRPPRARFLRRTVAAVRLLARDGGVPRWLRGLVAVGLLPVPGPFDEIVLLLAAAILWLGYRDRLRAAWREAGSRFPSGTTGRSSE